MFTFEKLYAEGHEEVVFFSDASCNLKANNFFVSFGVEFFKRKHDSPYRILSVT